MSDSSSSEEEKELLKEAIDFTFFPEDIYDAEKKKYKPLAAAEKQLPSLRNQNHLQNTFNPLEIKATPEFKAHVSKHLSRILNGIIDDTKQLPINNAKNSRNSKFAGIKLLKNSITFLQEETANQIEGIACNGNINNKSIKRNRNSDSTSSNSSVSSIELRVKEVAVTPDWILCGKETEFWAPNTRGEVEILKLKKSKRNKNKKKKIGPTETLGP